MFPTIMIVDDEPSILQSLSGLLSDEGFEVTAASNGYEALKMIEVEPPDLVLLDIWMPGIDGIETLKEIKKDNPFVQVVIITGHGSIEAAVKATKLGAFDLIEKPLSIDKVIVTINNALSFRRLEEENRYLRKKTIEKNAVNGTGPAISALKHQIAAVAPTDAWVLITGENGVGKELVARTIHQLSPRAEGPLVDVSCAAIPEALIDSELFGHERSAVPGATNRRRGKIEVADGGTLYFDEIGDMSLAAQARLLRVLEEQQFQRVGGDRVLKMNARIIASTGKNLEAEIAAGRFREALYYRLNVVPVHVPPLRERIEDIPILVEVFLDRLHREGRAPRKQISPAALEALSAHTWPGNVRELKNLIGRLAVMVGDETIEPHHLPDPTAAPPPPSDNGGLWVSTSQKSKIENQTSKISGFFAIDSFAGAMAAFEREYLSRRVAAHDGDLDRAAEAVGVDADFIRERLGTGA